MSQLTSLIHSGALGITVGSILYALSINIAALIALLASSPGRRRDARRVLSLLLRRPPDQA